MKNKLISQKTRSRASKVVLALFLCTIMISSLCSFTVGETFTFPETPPEYDYQTFTHESGQTVYEFCDQVLNYGNIIVSAYGNVFTRSVPFYIQGVDGLFLTDGITYSSYDAYFNNNNGISFTLVSYTNNNYTVSFLEALGLTPPTPTESLTNVWDGILNWITTSISSLQNVFWQEGTVIDFNSDVDTSDAITINDTVLYKSSFPFLTDGAHMVVNDTVIPGDEIFGDIVVVDSVEFYAISYDDVVLFAFASDGVVYTNSDVDFYLAYSPTAGLTLLGTLCCIAVAISVVFLLIGTIVNFLKLRS